MVVSLRNYVMRHGPESVRFRAILFLIKVSLRGLGRAEVRPDVIRDISIKKLI